MNKTRKTLLSLLVIAAAGGLIAFGVFSAFSATTDNPNNSFAAGSVAISDNDSNVSLYSVSGTKPGDFAERCIRVTYTGTLASTVKLYRSAFAGGTGLDPYIDLAITKGTGTAGDCSDFSGSTSVYAGTLGALGTTFAGGVALTDQGGAAAWDLNDAVDLQGQGDASGRQLGQRQGHRHPQLHLGGPEQLVRVQKERQRVNGEGGPVVLPRFWSEWMSGRQIAERWVRRVAFVAGLGLAAAAVLAWRTSPAAENVGLDLTLVANLTGELGVAPVGAVLHRRGMEPSAAGGGARGEVRLTNQTPSALAVRVRIDSSDRNLDRLVRVEIRAGGASGSPAEAWARFVAGAHGRSGSLGGSSAASGSGSGSYPRDSGPTRGAS